MRTLTNKIIGCHALRNVRTHHTRNHVVHRLQNAIHLALNHFVGNVVVKVIQATVRLDVGVAQITVGKPVSTNVRACVSIAKAGVTEVATAHQ